MEQVSGPNFAWGIFTGTVGSMLAVWLLFLLKPLWKRITAPTPLTYQAKLQIAQYLEMYEQSLRRLNHMAVNPKDLYLYLFQLTLTSFLLICTGLLLILVAIHYPPFGVPIVDACSAVALLFGLFLSIVAIYEAQRMSEKNISKTKAKIEARIQLTRAQLGDLAAVISTPVATSHHEPSANPQSPDSAGNAPS